MVIIVISCAHVQHTCSKESKRTHCHTHSHSTRRIYRGRSFILRYPGTQRQAFRAERREQKLCVLQIGRIDDRWAAHCLGVIPQAPEVRGGGIPRGHGERWKHLHDKRRRESNRIKSNHPCKSHQIFTSGALPTDAAREPNVPWKEGHALGVDGNQVAILKETDEVGL
jgi:hypothetical protein